MLDIDNGRYMYRRFVPQRHHRRTQQPHVHRFAEWWAHRYPLFAGDCGAATSMTITSTLSPAPHLPSEPRATSRNRANFLERALVESLIKMGGSVCLDRQRKLRA